MKRKVEPVTIQRNQRACGGELLVSGGGDGNRFISITSCTPEETISLLNVLEKSLREHYGIPGLLSERELQVAVAQAAIRRT